MNEIPASPPPVPSNLYRLVEEKLGSSLAEFIVQRRKTVMSSSGKQSRIPYRRIANELVDLTGVDITHEAVRRWHRTALAIPVAASGTASL